MQYLLGLSLAVGVAGFAAVLGSVIGVSSTLIALVGGLVFSGAYRRTGFKVGIDFAAGFVLRFGIVLMGLRISFGDVFALGFGVVLMVVGAIVLVISLGYFGAKIFGVRREFGVLSGGAVAICGASAAMAIVSVLPNYKNKERDLSLAVLVVTAFSTLEMIAHPLLTQALGFDAQASGVFMGAIIHDVAQSAGAGYSVSEEVGQVAVLTKMIRVSFIVPVVFGLAFLFRKQREAGGRGFKIPLFLVFFFGAIVLNSVLPLSVFLSEAVGGVSKFALLTAIAAIGVKTNLKMLVGVGFAPLALIGVQVLVMTGFVALCLSYFL